MESFHGNSKREKERALSKVQRRGGICLTTYGLVVTSWEQLGQREGVEFTWVRINREHKHPHLQKSVNKFIELSV